MHIKKKIRCLSEAPDDPIHPIKIARLKRQQSKILVYLKSEANSLETDQPNQQQQGDTKEEELYRLQSEILDHLLTTVRKVQLRETIQDQNDIKNEIRSLNSSIKQYLIKEKQRLRNHSHSEQQGLKFYYEEQISSIDEEMKHLNMVCNSDDEHQYDDQQHTQNEDSEHQPHAQNEDSEQLLGTGGTQNIELKETPVHIETDAEEN